MRTLTFVLAALCCAALTLEESAGAMVSKREDHGATENEIETIADLEKRLKKLVNSGFKIALPYLMEVVTETRLNQSCLQGLLMLVRGVMDIKDWAIKMVDALGKPSAGILEGTSIAMGDFDQCLDIVVPRRMRPPPTPPYTPKQIAFHGQYCVVHINLPEGLKKAAMAYQMNRSSSELTNSKTFLKSFVKIAPRADVASLRLGVCIPSICTTSDLHAIINEFTGKLKITATVNRCEKKEAKEITIEQIIILSGIAGLALLLLAGSITDLVLRPPLDKTLLQKKNFLIQSAVAFSIPRNVRKLLCLQTEKNSKIGCIRGMKFLTICLYIIVWTYATPQDFHFLKYRGAFYFYQFMEEWWFTIFANGAVGIDTIILIAGLQISYQFWKKHYDGNSKTLIPKFIIKWYIRFALAQGMVISLFLCLNLMGTGPFWGDVVTPIVENCRERWWLNLLAINNFWPSEKTCLPHTWLVCCLFHMLLVAPILLLILSKSVTVGLFVNVVIILGSSIAIAMITLMNNLPPTLAFYFLSFVNIKYIWQNVFIQAYDHMASFCVGVVLGYFLFRYNEIKLKKVTVITGWCATIVLNMTILCGLYGYRHGEAMGITLSAIYASVHRIGWALGISWIIFACAYGYGGFVNRFLSWKAFLLCDKLATLMYLLHPLVLFLHEGQLREKMYMAHLDQAMYATSYIVFSLVISAFCYVMCLVPFRFFEKKLWYYKSHTKNYVENKSEIQKKGKEHVYTGNNLHKEKGDFQKYLSSATYKQRIDKLFNT